MAGVYAQGFGPPEDFADQVGDLGRVRDTRGYGVGVRVVGPGQHGRQVVEVEPCTGCPLASISRRQAAAAGTRTSARAAGVRGGVPGRPASRPSASSRLTSRACSRGVSRPSSSAVDRPQQGDRLGRQRAGWPERTASASTTASASWRCRTPRRTAATAPPARLPAAGRRPGARARPARPSPTGAAPRRSPGRARSAAASPAGTSARNWSRSKSRERAGVAELDLLLPVRGGLAAQVAGGDHDVDVEPGQRGQRGRDLVGLGAAEDLVADHARRRRARAPGRTAPASCRRRRPRRSPNFSRLPRTSTAPEEHRLRLHERVEHAGLAQRVAVVRPAPPAGTSSRSWASPTCSTTRRWGRVMRPSWHPRPSSVRTVSTSPSRVYAARLVGLPIFDPQGDQVGKVRDLVVALRSEVSQPRVLGLVAEVFGRRRIFVPMTRVTNIDSGQVYTTGLLNMRRFEQRPTETLVVGQLFDRRVTVKATGRDRHGLRRRHGAGAQPRLGAQPGRRPGARQGPAPHAARPTSSSGARSRA